MTKQTKIQLQFVGAPERKAGVLVTEGSTVAMGNLYTLIWLEFSF